MDNKVKCSEFLKDTINKKLASHTVKSFIYIIGIAGIAVPVVKMLFLTFILHSTIMTLSHISICESDKDNPEYLELVPIGIGLVSEKDCVYDIITKDNTYRVKDALNLIGDIRKPISKVLITKRTQVVVNTEETR